MYFSSDGTYRILSLIVNFASAFSQPPSISSGDVVNEISESFFGITHGLRSKRQKVNASRNGTTNIINIVLTGDTPIEISAA